jgi:hypothetical protein
MVEDRIEMRTTGARGRNLIEKKEIITETEVIIEAVVENSNNVEVIKMVSVNQEKGKILTSTQTRISDFTTRTIQYSTKASLEKKNLHLSSKSIYS